MVTEAPALSSLPAIELDGAHLHALPGTHRQLQVSGRDRVKSLREAADSGDRLVLYAREEPFDPARAGGHPACLVRLVQNLELDPDEHKVIVTGLARGTAHFGPGPDLLRARFDRAEDFGLPDPHARLAAMRSVMRLVGKLERNGAGGLTNDAVRNLRGMDSLSRSLDFLVLSLATPDDAGFCQEMVAAADLEKRSLMVISFLSRRLEEGRIERSLRRRVKKQMERSHQEFHLSEQAKAIHEELEGGGKDGMQKLREEVAKSGMPDAAREKCESEIDRLGTVSPVSPEHSVIRTYVETLASLPWKERSGTGLDMAKAKEVLDADHHGLAKVKDRIMEYLAVQRRVGKPSGSVLCFVGPPGVGKTSLGQSIARATGREFVRTSLGGVHEEAAIRGHRRTYVASMPGRIIKAMAKAGVRNPVFMLDEFDKMGFGYSYHGDPSAALLEVLDPEQNSTFVDQYLEVEFDLSEVMFITTANEVGHLPDALHDRLEIIRLPGYTDDEKLSIASRHLVGKQLSAHGLKPGDLSFPKAVMLEIVRDYTYEAGVRELERNIARICRKVATERVIKGKDAPASARITKAQVRRLLEVPDHYSKFSPPGRDRVGYANGLVYGRGLFPMEAVVYREGEGRVDVTGVTRGSDEIGVLCEVALTLMKANRESLGLAADFAKDRAVHVHLQNRAGQPYGALGMCMYALLVSAFTKIPVRSGTAMLGEVNLRGDVISSEHYSEYKATVMDAQRNGIGRIVMPAEDRRLLADLPKELTADIEFVLVRDVAEALRHSLARAPKRLPKEAGKSGAGRGGEGAAAPSKAAAH